ncbi:MAG: phage major capsid protein [Paracoccus sp. (in: a-proteobacteria)]|jgi:HK97 family phage major capsid protein/HK97 family phage prohead protease|uniref:phage major capsid protein n=1 Tax=Paracoccus sp. TaxID=267 RepID=UPI0032D997C9
MSKIEVKAQFTVDEAGVVEGIAWPFGSPDRVGDVIELGAFAKTLPPIPMLAFHEQRETVGVWDEILETPAGLQVKGRLLIEDLPRAREVRAMIRERALSGLSIGFSTTKAAPRKGGGRTISALELLEISVVAVPAHPGARITSAKEHDMSEQTQTPDIAALEAKMTAMEQKADTSALVSRLDKLEAKANRPFGGTVEAKPDAVEKKAFESFIRRGMHSLNEDDRKTLNMGTDTAGGYVVAPEFSTRVLQTLSERSSMRAIANIMAIGTTEIIIPTLTGNVQPGWVAEIGPRPVSEPTFGRKSITVHEQAVIVPVSQQLLEDSLIDLEAFLRNHIAREFGKMEEAAFVNGDGVGKPLGFLAEAADYETITTAVDGSGLVDDLIALFYALPTEYARNGTWVMNRATMAAIRGATDNTDRMIWGDSLSNGQPATLLGRPIREMVDMPSLATGAYAAAFGDFNAGYQIVDRIGIQTLRDDFTGADQGIVKIRARRRVGGAPVMPEAIAVLRGA